LGQQQQQQQQQARPPMAPPPPQSHLQQQQKPVPPPASNVQFYQPAQNGGAPVPVAGQSGPPATGPPPPQPVDRLAEQFGGMGVGAPPPMSGGQGQSVASPGGMGAVVEAVEIDDAANCKPAFMKCTLGRIPHSDKLGLGMKLPIGVVLTPMALDRTGEDCPVDVINFGKSGIVRCKRCRTYINPFVVWVNNGRQWRCNICSYVNEVPHEYFSHLDEDGNRRDKAQRPELSQGSVELVAPSEYMLRPPQAPVYVFVLDVSQNAVASGMLATAASTIKACLNELPGQGRTQIGFVAYDSAVHFFNLKSTLSQPQMLTVPDLSELFLPLPDDLLVNLGESREVVDALLDALPTMFQQTRKIEVALGPALVAAYRIMSHIGGKMCVFVSNLPSAGEARLKHREDLRKMGTPEEHHQLNPDEQWYKSKAVEFHRLQICVDLFLFSGQYTDVATLKELPKYTAGSLYYYPAFHGGFCFFLHCSTCLGMPTSSLIHSSSRMFDF
jgi:protein transport protein SEC24